MYSRLGWILFGFFLFSASVHAQNRQVEEKSPQGAFFRSLLIPGWGHRYVDKTDWGRGQRQFAIDAILLVSYFGLRDYSGRLHDNAFAFAQKETGINLKERNRDFELAVTNFNSLAEYNDFQLRTRNWDRLFPVTAQNQWQWQSQDQRQRFVGLKDRADRIDQQLPLLLAFVAGNHIISAISSFRAANRYNQNLPRVEFGLAPNLENPAFPMSTLRIGF